MAKDKRLSKYETQLEYIDLMNQYSMLAMNVYEWKNLPEHLHSRQIEKMLFENGRVVWFDTDDLPLTVLKATPNSDMNVMGEPIRFYASGFNRQFDLSVKDCVECRNNTLAVPTILTIKLAVIRMLKIKKTIDVNVSNQKTPYVVACDTNTLNTFKNVMKKVDENEPVIYTDKGFNVGEKIEILPSIAPYVSDKLTDLMHDIENQLFTRLGINNANTDKRERLNQEEVNANNQAISIYADNGLRERLDACKRINKKYGTNITVVIKGVGDDGSIHNDDTRVSGE